MIARVFALAALVAVSGCAAVKAEAKANGITEQQQIMADIIQDAEADWQCAVALPVVIGQVYAGDIAALVPEAGCLIQAVKLIYDQVRGGAQPPTKPALLATQTAKTLIKASTASK